MNMNMMNKLILNVLKRIYDSYTLAKNSVFISATASFYPWYEFFNNTALGQLLVSKLFVDLNFSVWFLSTGVSLITLFFVIITLEGIEFLLISFNFPLVIEFSKLIKENFLNCFITALTAYFFYLNNFEHGYVLRNLLRTWSRYWIQQVLSGATSWLLPAVAAALSPLIVLLALEILQWCFAFNFKMPISQISELLKNICNSDLNEPNPNLDNQPETVENSKSAEDNSQKKKSFYSKYRRAIVVCGTLAVFLASFLAGS